MELKRSKQMSCLLWAAVFALLSQNMAISVMASASSFEDQKNFFPPYPHFGTPPTVSYTPPAQGSGGGHATPTPSHGTPPVNCGNPPSGGGGQHSTPTPSHHSSPTPSHHSNPTPSHHSSPTPSHHSSPTPSHGSGGYYHSPPTSTPTPTTPTTPAPVTVTPPSTPSTPTVTVPSPPSSFDPNSPPFTCTYWKSHPTLIWGLFGWSGTTVGVAFGVTSLPGIGAKMDLLGALSNTRTDGLGDLCREGTAALLNSMVHGKFPYTTSQVRNSFLAAAGSDKAAAAQAQLFKLANEGKAIPRA